MNSPDASVGKSPEERWWSVRAGEYVLGTLRGEDLALFERILTHDTAVQDEVARWENRLAALNENTRERTPGEHVWPLVLERIRATQSADVEAADVASGESAAKEASGRTAGAGRLDRARVADVRSGAGEDEETGTETPETKPPRAIAPHSEAANSSPWRSPFWPALAGLATAASLVLGILLFQRTSDPFAAPLSVDGLAVVLSDESGEPYFLVETDYGNLRVRVTALSPPGLDGERDFQLWQALPDRSSVRPVALLPEEAGASRVFEVDSLIDGSDLFGVSIEPVGAPTDAGPTGPVVAHGDFLETREAD